jgi:hypothetical protein
MAVKTTSSRDMSAELAYLTRALKAPTLREAVDRLAERARAETWTYEEFLGLIAGVGFEVHTNVERPPWRRLGIEARLGRQRTNAPVKRFHAQESPHP